MLLKSIFGLFAFLEIGQERMTGNDVMGERDGGGLGNDLEIQTCVPWVYDTVWAPRHFSTTAHNYCQINNNLANSSLVSDNECDLSSSCFLSPTEFSKVYG